MIRLLPLLFLLTSCAVTTQVLDDQDNQILAIKSKADAIVEYSVSPDGTQSLKVNNQGRPSIPEQVLGIGAAALANGVQVEVGD